MNEALTRHLLLPLHERLRGRTTMGAYAELRRCDQMGLDEIARLRQRKLSALLEHCRAHVPWYREMFRQRRLDRRGGLGLDTLAELPILEREEVRMHGDRMIAETHRNRVLPASTGGSSGEPLRFHTDRIKEACHNAQKLRFRRWFGVRPGDRQVDFWGSPIELRRQSRLRVFKDRHLLNQVLLSAHDIGTEQLNRYVTFLAAYRPRLIYGYPSVIRRVAAHVDNKPGCLGDYRPCAVVCTSEMLLPQVREAIGAAFGCPVANEYGARDGGLVAHECQAGCLHVAAEHVLVEIDQPDSDGVGDLLITNLDGYGMPFLRYRIGDRGSLGGGTCDCGSPLPLLGRLQGRMNDFLVGREGRQVHGSAANYVLREIPGIVQYRLLQRTDLSVDVWLITDGNAPEDIETRIRMGLSDILDREADVRLHRVDDIPRSASGKHRWVESEAASA